MRRRRRISACRIDREPNRFLILCGFSRSAGGNEEIKYNASNPIFADVRNFESDPPDLEGRRNARENFGKRNDLFPNLEKRRVQIWTNRRRKARKRMSEGGKGGIEEGSANLHTLEMGKDVAEILAKKYRHISRKPS